MLVVVALCLIVSVLPPCIASAEEVVVSGPVVAAAGARAEATADSPLPPPAHPPLSEIPPMPMPWGDGPSSGRRDELRLPAGDTIIYNAATGEARRGSDDRRSQLPSPGLQPGIPGRPGPVLDEPDQRSYSTMSPIGSTDTYPWRANTKLVMRFVDNLGIDRFFNCSGTMIDPEVVLTAAHCVYAHEPNGLVINDWAQEVWAYPGWDGSGAMWSSPNGTIIDPYGYARGTWYIAGANYVNGTDTNNADVAAVELTRAVGSLTGTFCYAWDFDCGTWILSNTSNNASYPGETCDAGAGLHTGRDMYFWSGTVDWCDPNGDGWGNQLFIDTTGGCFNAGWGGMSGSSIYFFHDSNRCAHAVTSRSDRATWVSYARIWNTMGNDLQNQFVPGARGVAFDIQALDFSGPVAALASANLTTCSFFVTNPTQGSANTSYPLDLYLSTNANITSGDTYLGSTSFSWNFTAMSSVTVNVSSLTIPFGTPSGAYYLGAILSSSVDGNSSNNKTDNWDAHPISIAGVWDLSAQSVSAPSGSFDLGSNLAVGFSAKNFGGDPTAGFWIRLYASTNTDISASDTKLFEVHRGAIGGGATSSGLESVTLPWTMAPGTYYIGMEITPDSPDAGVYSNETYDAVPITVVDPTIFEDDFEAGNTRKWSATIP